MPGHGRGVEGLEGKAERAAAEDGLLHVSDFLRAVVLVELFEVHDAEVTEGHRNGFQLAGVVQTVELDGLPGGKIGQCIGSLLLFPQVPDAHPVDDAVVLRPDRSSYGVAHLAQDDSVDVGHPHDEQDVLGGGKGGFQASAPSVAQILVVLAGPDGRMGRVIFRDDQAAQLQLLFQQIWGLPSSGCHPQTPPFRRSRAAPGARSNAPGHGFSGKSTWHRGRRSGPS